MTIERLKTSKGLSLVNTKCDSSKPALKTDLKIAVEQLELQAQKVGELTSQLSQKLMESAKSFADYHAKKDSAHANVCGCVLAEKVVIVKKFVQVRFALEKTTMMIREVPESVESLDTLAVSIEVLRKVRGIIQYPMPTVEQKLGEAELLLEQTATTSAKGNDIKADTERAKQRAEEIMKKAFKEAEAEIATKLSARTS